MLQDLNHDVIGIADIDGTVPRVVARFSYDAYGRVLSAVVPPVGVPPAPAPPPPLSVGHHGLFAEDADTNLADLTHGPNTNWWVAGVGSPLSPDTQNLLYLTPNRVLSPKLGRWLQADPNQTAQAVLGSITFGGMPVGASVSEFDLKGRFGDGVNLYQYVRSNPIAGGDPTGLLAMDLIETGVRTVVGGLRGGLQEMIGEYGENQEFDLDWASDWDQADNWHSRGSNQWVGQAFARGLVRGALGELDPTGGLLVESAGGPSMAGMAGLGGKALRQGAKAGRAITGKVGDIGSYGQLRKLTAGFGGDIQAHKLVEKRHLKDINIDIDNVPAVILTREQHQKVTNALRQAIPYGSDRPPSKNELLAALRTAYSDNPRWYQHAKRFVDSIDY